MSRIASTSLNSSVRILLSIKLPLFILLVCYSQMVFAFSGIIVDISGKPVVGAVVTDKHNLVYSRKDGSFSIATEADSIYVTRLGFQRLALNSKSSQSSITLIASDIILPTVWVRAVEYKPISPSLGAQIIHPDTNAKVKNAADLLLENPSFSSTDIRLTGEKQTVSLLGSFNRHSLVMLDGVVLNPSGEAFDFSKIPLSQISYIEVIKGNSSVYGGSAAIGGIVHLHSKPATNKPYWDGSVSSSLGSFDLYKQVYSTTFSHKMLSLNAEYFHQTAKNDFEYQSPDFWNVEQELKRLHNRKTADNGFLKASFSQGRSQIDYSLNLGSFVRELPGTINFLDLYNDSKVTGAYSQQSFRILDTHKHLANEILGWWNTDQSIFANLNSINTFAANHYRQKQQSRGVKSSSNLNYETYKLGLSAEYSDIDYRFENFITDNDIRGKRENTALAFRAQKNLFPFYLEYKIVTAIREDYSDKALHPTWRVEHELSLPLAEKLVVGGYLGTAFSQPSLFDMYWIGDSETQGNPNLKSESSFGYNAYGEISLPTMKLRIAYYHNWVENLIQWRQYYLNGVSWKPFNAGKADIQNMELEYQIRMYKQLSLSSNFTYTHAYDASKRPDGSPATSYNKKLVYTPDLKATAKLFMETDRHGISFAYNYTGQQYSTVDNLIDPLPAFDTLELTAFYTLKLNNFLLRCDLKVNNLLNKHYEIYAYTPQPGINWFTGLSISHTTQKAESTSIYPNKTTR
ncbi:MAG: TonB-dependent receptor plug domain-containing protein [Candidatus Cloacimonetes bacterium]|nr:TonB-dependent receptor plug domain-containing protein [Candidatus Cloacimonadota bacterium]